MLNILLSINNVQNYIIEQLSSLLSQTYTDYHIFIRDDGSTDNTIAIIEKYLKENQCANKVTIIKGENIGFSKSFFTLLKTASEGDYWAFCDQDDVWYPYKLKLAVEWMQGKPDQTIPLLYHSGFEIGNADLSEKEKYPYCKFPYKFQNSITSNVFFGFCCVINRPLYERLIKADSEQIKYHDWFAAMITAAFGYSHRSHQIMAVHRQHEDNTSPLYFFKKIPDGLKLLGGDNFYKRNAREFERLFGEELNEQDQKILGWFTHRGYSLRIACKKAFYPHRWNPKMSVEIVQRILMLFGVI